MSPDQAQAQSPLPDQPIREGQLDEDKGQDGQPQDESPHLMERETGFQERPKKAKRQTGFPPKETMHDDPRATPNNPEVPVQHGSRARIF